MLCIRYGSMTAITGMLCMKARPCNFGALLDGAPIHTGTCALVGDVSVADWTERCDVFGGVG